MRPKPSVANSSVRCEAPAPATVESVQKRLAASAHVPADPSCAPVQGPRTCFQEEEYALQCADGEQEQPKGDKYRKKQYQDDHDCRHVAEGISDDGCLIHWSPIPSKYRFAAQPWQRGDVAGA